MNDYLDELRNKLSGFAQAERAEILEEIESHIEAGMEDGRFQSNPSNLTDEMGSPPELARRLHSIHNRRRWIELLLIVIPTLIIEFGLNIAIKVGYLFSPNLSETFLANLTLVWGGIFLMTVVGAIWLSWRKQFTVIGLWFLSENVAYLWLPLFTAPFMAKFMVGATIGSPALQNWIFRIAGLLLWGWAVWRSRHDGLALTFGLIPLALSVATQWFGVLLLNSSINFIADEQYRLIEHLLRFLMWSAVPTAYFLLRVRWQRWLGMGTAVYLYLFAVTYLVLNPPGSSIFGAIYYVVAIWTAAIFTFGIGLLLDRSNLIVPRRGLAA